MDRGDQAWRSGDTSARWSEMTFAGALSFLRRPYSREFGAADIVVSGVPFDLAVTARPGCRFGPRAIRAASAEIGSTLPFPWGFNPFEALRVIDAGDAWIDVHHPEAVPAAIEAWAVEILAAGARMLTLGGDHFITYPLLKAHAAQHGPLALVQFDAHCDLWPDNPERLDHGTAIGRAVRDGIVDPARSVQIGIRTYHDDDAGVEMLTAPWVHREGVGAAIEAVAARATGPVYVSFDIDVLDPAFAPGTGTPMPGGLATWQALEILRGLKALDMVGFDLVEVSPPYDHAEITALAAATVAHDWICLMAERRGAVPRPVGRL